LIDRLILFVRLTHQKFVSTPFWFLLSPLINPLTPAVAIRE